MSMKTSFTVHAALLFPMCFSVIEMRRYNDRAMKLSQSFIYPEGLPDRPQYK